MRTITIGSFDGVHSGHKSVIRTAMQNASHVTATTFEPIPRQLFGGQGWKRRLSCPGERLELLAEQGISEVRVVPFNESVRALSPLEFLDSGLGEDRFDRIVVGYDFHFGAARQGGPDTLREWCDRRGCDLVVVPPTLAGSEPAKSQRVRRLVAEGDLDGAQAILGHRYFLTGVVERGLGVGRKIGFPTLNIRLPLHKLLPPSGSYVAVVRLPESGGGVVYMPAAAYVPPCSGNTPPVEAHVPGSKLGDLYGHLVRVELGRFIRPPESGLSETELRKAIASDVEEVHRRDPIGKTGIETTVP
jgi:riboflavin kinase/FMN adenylyltransferase